MFDDRDFLAASAAALKSDDSSRDARQPPDAGTDVRVCGWGWRDGAPISRRNGASAANGL